MLNEKLSRRAMVETNSKQGMCYINVYRLMRKAGLVPVLPFKMNVANIDTGEEMGSSFLDCTPKAIRGIRELVVVLGYIAVDNEVVRHIWTVNKKGEIIDPTILCKKKARQNLFRMRYIPLKFMYPKDYHKNLLEFQNLGLKGCFLKTEYDFYQEAKDNGYNFIGNTLEYYILEPIRQAELNHTREEK